MQNIKKTALVCTLVAAFAATCLNSPLRAQGSPASPPPAHKEEKTRSIPYNGKLTVADAKAMTFRLHGKEKSRLYHVGAETRIIKDGQKATLEDMAEGVMISGSAVVRTDGDLDALLVRIGPKSASEKKTAGKKKSSDS